MCMGIHEDDGHRWYRAASPMRHECLWAHTKVMVTDGAGGKDAEMQRARRILSYR